MAIGDLQGVSGRMDLQLRDKLALVTGGSKGIGAATAIVFAEEGADVIVCYGRDREGAERVAGEVRARGREAWVESCDVADPGSVEVLGARLRARDVQLDVLISCAGLSTVTPFDELDFEQWREILGVNLDGPFLLLHTLRPLFAESASVVLVASVAAHTGVPHHAHYAAAKAGVVSLTKSAARAWAPNVRVNCVAPGMTLTEMGKLTATALPEDYARRQLLSHRFAEPEEIARSIVFVASPVAGFMTGATLDINGGRILR